MSKAITLKVDGFERSSRFLAGAHPRQAQEENTRGGLALKERELSEVLVIRDEDPSGAAREREHVVVGSSRRLLGHGEHVMAALAKAGDDRRLDVLVRQDLIPSAKRAG